MKTMRVSRCDLVRDICRKVGISRRKPDRETFSKAELLKIHSWIDLVNSKFSGDANAGDHQAISKAQEL